jgi:hypothetical protein
MKQINIKKFEYTRVRACSINGGEIDGMETEKVKKEAVIV